MVDLKGITGWTENRNYNRIIITLKLYRIGVESKT